MRTPNSNKILKFVPLKCQARCENKGLYASLLSLTKRYAQHQMFTFTSIPIPLAS